MSSIMIVSCVEDGTEISEPPNIHLWRGLHPLRKESLYSCVASIVTVCASKHT